MNKLLILISLVCSPLYAGEAIIFVGTDPSPDKTQRFEDGDIVDARNDTQILRVGIEKILHPSLVERTPHGTIDPNGVRGEILDMYLTRTKEFRYQRITDDAITKTDLTTGASYFINATANENGEYMDVPFFLKRRLSSPRNYIFGVKGSEYWFGGRSTWTLSDMNAVSSEIETKMGIPKSTYSRWPFTEREKQRFLLIDVDDFSFAERAEMISPLYEVDCSTCQIKMRKSYVNWANDLNLSNRQKSDIRNSGVPVDLRGVLTVGRGNVVRQKSR